MRKLLAGLAALALVPGGLLAAEIRGQVKKVDSAANTVTITVDGKDQTYPCAQNCQVTTMFTSRGGLLSRRNTTMEVAGTMQDVTTGSQVTLITETKNGTEQVTQIRTQGGLQTGAQASVQSGVQTSTGMGYGGIRGRLANLGSRVRGIIR
ncbi:MAG: hypothetical protein L0Y70_03990 [Gemmataceae bacterium]|nr:hypothetical protein [Gemmataceae bacterium]